MVNITKLDVDIIDTKHNSYYNKLKLLELHEMFV